MRGWFLLILGNILAWTAVAIPGNQFWSLSFPALICILASVVAFITDE